MVYPETRIRSRVLRAIFRPLMLGYIYIYIYIYIYMYVYVIYTYMYYSLRGQAMGEKKRDGRSDLAWSVRLNSALD